MNSKTRKYNINIRFANFALCFLVFRPLCPCLNFVHKIDLDFCVFFTIELQFCAGFFGTSVYLLFIFFMVK